jgi:hypothetical protein
VLMALLAAAAVGCKAQRPSSEVTAKNAAEPLVQATPADRQQVDGGRKPLLDRRSIYGQGEDEPWSVDDATDESKRGLIEICHSIRRTGVDRSCDRDQDCTPTIACIGVNARDLRGRQEMEEKWRATGCPTPPRCLRAVAYCRARVCY